MNNFFFFVSSLVDYINKKLASILHITNFIKMAFKNLKVPKHYIFINQADFLFCNVNYKKKKQLTKIDQI